MIGADAMPSYPCSFCSEEVGDGGVQCNGCKVWLHPTCVLTSSVAATTKVPSKLPQWFYEFLGCNLVQVKCSVCSKCQPENENPDVARRMDAVESKVDKLVRMLDPLLSVPNIAIANRTEGTKRSYRDVTAKNIPTRLATIADIQELQKDDKDSRSIVVLGLPERGQDCNDIDNLLKCIDPSARAIEYFRMGISSVGANLTGQHGREGASQKPRLLKVILPSSTVVRSVLHNSPKLKDLNSYSGVYIRRSMPSQERALLRQLYLKMKEFNNQARVAGSRTKYVIVNEKMLKYDNCAVLEEGGLGRGVLDRNFSFVPSQVNEVNDTTNNAEKGGEGGRAGTQKN